MGASHVLQRNPSGVTERKQCNLHQVPLTRDAVMGCARCPDAVMGCARCPDAVRGCARCLDKLIAAQWDAAATPCEGVEVRRGLTAVECRPTTLRRSESRLQRQAAQQPLPFDFECCSSNFATSPLGSHRSCSAHLV